MTLHLLLAHGSPDPRHARTIDDLAARLSRRGLRTEAAYLDHDEPQVGRWFAGHTDSRPVVTLGLFLGRGHHVHVDVPRALASAPAGLDVVDRGLLGVGPWLEPVLDDLLHDAGRASTDPVLLVTAGTQRRSARQTAERFGRRWASHRGGPVTVSHDPAHVASHSHGRSLVMPLLICPGILADRITLAANAAGLPVAQPLCGSRSFVDVVARRLVPQGQHA